MRADRLVATLLVLQTRGRVTAAELAVELEVSIATARRDLEALSTAGIPVYPQAGRGGGWSLVGGARTDLTGFTAPEAQALFLLAGPAAAVAPEVKSALRKLVRALPDTFRADAQAAADAVVVDPAGWGQSVKDLPELIGELQTAVVRRRKVQLEYAGRSGESTQRDVDPWGLVDKNDVWYLIAGTDRGQRTFRVDRMVSVFVTNEKAERPVDFDLSEQWERVVQEMEQRRSSVSATILIAAALVPVVQSHFGRHCTVQATEPDGRQRLAVSAHTPASIAEQLAGWGSTVEVVDSPLVQAELARIGQELLARYAG